MLLSRQDLLPRQVVPEEDTIMHQAEVITTPIRIVLQTAHHTTDHLEQIQARDLLLLLEEVNPQATILEIHQVGLLQILPVLALQADQVLEQVTAHQVEVQVGPQVALAQEDPEEGGINSPFFLEKLSENDHNFVTNSTYHFST